MDTFVHEKGPLSVLQQRILFAESHLRTPAFLVENFPEWPQQAFEKAIGAGNGCESHAPSASNTAARRYLPSRGSDELIELIIRHEQQKYAVTLARESILVTAGGMHALWLAFRSIAARRPGSTVLCLDTVFVGVANLIRMSGLDIRFVAGDLAALTVEDVERHLLDDISSLYTNSPHNPSGEYLSREKMRQISGLCERRGLSCVVDAVYDSCFFDGGCPTLPTGLGQSDRSYLICSMSKNFGLPGARIGWLISSEPNISTTLSWLESENVSISSVSQELAIRVLMAGSQPLAASMKVVRGIVLDFLTREFNIRRLPPAGTQMALRLPFPDVEHFADDALNRHELVLATSSNYAGCRGGFIRLPFSYLPENTERALQRLELAIHTYLERHIQRA